MNDDEKGAVCGLVLLSLVAGVILGWRTTTHVYQNEALKAGVGYYDGQTGTFKYKTLEGEVKSEKLK
jgi:hypothetical protein